MVAYHVKWGLPAGDTTAADSDAQNLALDGKYFESPSQMLSKSKISPIQDCDAPVDKPATHL